MAWQKIGGVGGKNFWRNTETGKVYDQKGYETQTQWESRPLWQEYNDAFNQVNELKKQYAEITGTEAELLKPGIQSINGVFHDMGGSQLDFKEVSSAVTDMQNELALWQDKLATAQKKEGQANSEFASIEAELKKVTDVVPQFDPTLMQSWYDKLAEWQAPQTQEQIRALRAEQSFRDPHGTGSGNELKEFSDLNASIIANRQNQAFEIAASDYDQKVQALQTAQNRLYEIAKTKNANNQANMLASMKRNWKLQDEQNKLVQAQRDYYSQEQLAKQLAAQQKQVDPWSGALVGAGTGALTGAAAGGGWGALIGAVAGGISGYGGGQVSVPTNYEYLKQKKQNSMRPYTTSSSYNPNSKLNASGYTGSNLYSGGSFNSGGW